MSLVGRTQCLSNRNVQKRLRDQVFLGSGESGDKISPKNLIYSLVER